VLAAALLVATASQQAGRADGYAPGEYPFASLGWGEDVILDAARPEAEVVVALPNDAQQGGKLWYGVRMEYEWLGRPSQNESVQLDTVWNDQSAHALLVKTPAWAKDWLEDQEWIDWQTVDVVNGGSRGLVLGQQFSIKSSNFAPFASVKGGENRIRVRLSTLSGQVPERISVRVSRSSAVVVSRLGPAALEFRAHAQLHDRALTVRVQGENRGIASPPVQAVAIVYYQDGRRISLPSEGRVPGVAADGKFERTFAVELPESRPSAVQIALDWDAGVSAPITVVPGPANERWSAYLGRASIIIFCVAAAWIGIPATIRAARTL
jgi:hypothetical protein